MRNLWMLCCGLLLGLLAFTPASALGSEASFEQATASARCVPNSVQIGEPFTLYLDIVHDAELRVLLHTPDGGEEQLFGDRWELLESRSTVRLPLNDGSSRQLTQSRWRLFALEPGDYELPTLGADCLASGAVQRVEAPTAAIIVRAELTAEEDAARALLGFREPPTDSEGPLGAILGGIVFAWGALILVLVGLMIRHFKGRKQPDPAPTALSRLQGFDASDESGIRDLYFGVSKLVREALENEPLHGRTDEEWLAAQRERADLSADLVERAARFLALCGEVKYAANLPTRWAAEEALKEATAICSDAQLEKQGVLA